MKTNRTITTPHGEVNVEVHYNVGDYGIGAYEFWGMRGTDTQWCVEVEDIISTDERVNKYIDDNFDKLALQLESELESEGEVDNYLSSQEDCDGDAWSGGFADNH